MNILPKGLFNVKQVLTQFREELDEHLAAINENTDEIQSNYSHLQEIDYKLNQLAARLDRIEAMLGNQPQKISIQPLTYEEKQVFLVLYTDDAPLTYSEIAQRTSYSVAMVKHYLDSLIEKGVPLAKSYFNSNPFIKLDPAFKELQAKENLINLSLKSFVENLN